MVPPPHHLFLRWEPEAPLPRAGLLSLFSHVPASGAREAAARRRVIQAEDRPTPPGPKELAAGPESCVSVEKPRHRPGASSLLRRTANLLTRTSQIGIDCHPSVHGGGHARRSQRVPRTRKALRRARQSRDHTRSARAIPLAANVLDPPRRRSRHAKAFIDALDEMDSAPPAKAAE
jgi:hypothetical protein